MAIAPHASARATDHLAVDAHGHADGEAAHAAREHGGVVGLDEEVQVIGLNGVVDDAKPIAACLADRLANEAMEAVDAKAR
jgi:hypothetical protein